MPASDQRHSPRYRTARERIAARRAVRRRTRLSFPALAGGLLALFVLVTVVVLWRRTDATLATIEQRDPRQRTPASTAAPAPASGQAPDAPEALPGALAGEINILLIGVDQRPDDPEGVRSDTLIVVHLDAQDRWAGMLSIPRDSVVQVPHLGWAKINAAYAFGYRNAEEIYGAGTPPEAGGGALAAETVEQFLGIPIDYIAQVNFEGFEQLVDAAGGLLIDVEKPLLDAEYPTEDFGVERIYIPAGLQVMDGRTALIYARSRHSSSDFDRSRRQQQVLSAMLEQVRAQGLLENVEQLPQWADILSQHVRTTLPLRDLATISALAALARDIDSSRIVQMSINPNDVAIDAEDGSDIYWNQADVQALVARWLRGPQSPGATVRVQVLNGAAVQGIAGRVSDFLREQGFDVVEPGDAPHLYAQTVIVDVAGAPEALARLVATLGIDPGRVPGQPGTDAPPHAPGVDLVLVIGSDYQQWWRGE